ncbi:minor capsid protein [Capybara microvirus Cap3_SP_550]|nr:minor capsid protein [Capybara microvirus Cap3_SP_550]
MANVDPLTQAALDKQNYIDNYATDYEKATDAAESNLDSSYAFSNSLFGKLVGYDSVAQSYQALLNAKMANAFNSAEAQKQRDFEEYMSSTAYQRAAKDLTEIGFSPFALFEGSHGASTPSGSSASSSQASTHGSSDILGTLVKAIAAIALKSSFGKK